MPNEDQLLQDVLRRTQDAELGYQNIADCTNDVDVKALAISEVELRHRFKGELERELPSRAALPDQDGTSFGWMLRRWKDCCALVRSERGMLKAAEIGIDTTVQSYRLELESNPRSPRLRNTLQSQLAHIFRLRAKVKMSRLLRK